VTPFGISIITGSTANSFKFSILFSKDPCDIAWFLLRFQFLQRKQRARKGIFLDKLGGHGQGITGSQCA
jgi:hypothetical protein